MNSSNMNVVIIVEVPLCYCCCFSIYYLMVWDSSKEDEEKPEQKQTLNTKMSRNGEKRTMRSIREYCSKNLISL